MTERPFWWQYPTQCHHVHEWGPGLVTAGWMLCECPEAQAGIPGHLWGEMPRGGRDAQVFGIARLIVLSSS